MTNDLYSFDKEERGHQKHGGLFLNAMDVIRKTYNVSTFTAKRISRDIMLDLELRFHEEFKRLVNNDDLEGEELLTSRQRRFAKELVECIAGHIY
jgi:hypothetical protein